MSDITIEQKLELMRQIRSRNERDRFDMSKREQLLYGKSMESTDPAINAVNTDLDEEGLSTLPLRILLSAAFLLVIIISDMSGKSFMGIYASQCFEVLATDYESSISTWVDAASGNTVSGD